LWFGVELQKLIPGRCPRASTSKSPLSMTRQRTPERRRSSPVKHKLMRGSVPSDPAVTGRQAGMEGKEADNYGRAQNVTET
jgi:hypothetical protein